MTNTNYIKKHRDKRAADGLVRVDVWVHNTNKAEIKALAKQLEVAKGWKDTGKPSSSTMTSTMTGTMRMRWRMTMTRKPIFWLYAVLVLVTIHLVLDLGLL